MLERFLSLKESVLKSMIDCEIVKDINLIITVADIQKITDVCNALVQLRHCAEDIVI